MRKEYAILLVSLGIVLAACNPALPTTADPTITPLSRTPTRQVQPTHTGTQVPNQVPTETLQPLPSATISFSERTPTPAQQTASPESTNGSTRFKDCSLSSFGLIPLLDMSADQDYHGQEGGLYGNGENEPPAAHQRVARQESTFIMPRDPEGNPSPEGIIGLVAIGMSNARMEFDRFERIAGEMKSDAVVLVNGAQPAKLASNWAEPDPNDDPWAALIGAVDRAGLTPEQVQVVWLKDTNAGPRPGRDDFPVYAEALRDDLGVMVKRVKTLFPNVGVLYFSSRIYAGYSLIPLSPEPFAYEDGFAVRWLILDQIEGGGVSGVTYENAPVLLWGPYLWADGATPRSDGLAWLCEDLLSDGVHPESSGRQKVAEMLLNFFSTDPLTSAWFLRSGG